MWGCRLRPLSLLPLVFALPALGSEKFSFPDAQNVVQQYCVNCHRGRKPAGNLDVSRFGAMKSVAEDPRAWTRIYNRVRDEQMPPAGLPAPDRKTRESFVAWIDSALRTAACADGIAPAVAPARRLNRTEYAATVRDLLNIHINAGSSLPADGAGGEGFDNAAETLTISPIHAEKYLEAAKAALHYAFSDPKARGRFLVADPESSATPEAAARKNLEAFLPRAFRRPAAPGEVDRYLALFRAAKARGDDFDAALEFALAGVMVSPHFLFRLEEPNPDPAPRLAPDYVLASRLSYFLWGSMPDDTLLALAAEEKLRDTAVLKGEIARMLKDTKSRDFAENFVEQWLGTRELGRDIKPDPKLFPMYYDAELQAAIRYEPVLFFQEILAGNHSLLELLDARFTFLTNKLVKHYGLEIPKTTKVGQQPVKVDLPEGSHRGGILGMSAVLAVSSYPNRTSPVLRGKWILDAVLGTPPPPPPPNVPQLPEHSGAAPATLRERLMEHRRDPGCASCHNRIDPLGFALENYDVLGRWRTEDAGKPIDSIGQLPDGTKFGGATELKQVLLDRKQLFLRNLTSKMLGYALGRGLTLEDACTVDTILDKLPNTNYSAQALIEDIVLSVPFRYQAGSDPARSVPETIPQTQETPR